MEVLCRVVGIKNVEKFVFSQNSEDLLPKDSFNLVEMQMFF
jgi:hypothetical protein